MGKTVLTESGMDRMRMASNRDVRVSTSVVIDERSLALLMPLEVWRLGFLYEADKRYFVDKQEENDKVHDVQNSLCHNVTATGHFLRLLPVLHWPCQVHSVSVSRRFSELGDNYHLTLGIIT